MGRGGVALGLLPMENAAFSVKGLRVSACVSTPLGALPNGAAAVGMGLPASRVRALRSFHCRPLGYGASGQEPHDPPSAAGAGILLIY
jgi:hypothetical protein